LRKNLKILAGDKRFWELVLMHENGVEFMNGFEKLEETIFVGKLGSFRWYLADLEILRGLIGAEE
jgi:hypothetical protein